MISTLSRRHLLSLGVASIALAATPAWSQTAPPIPVRPYVPPKYNHPIAKTAKPLKVAVIGAGNVGGAYGTSWSMAGHHVMFADRDPAIAKARAADNPGATSGTTAQAIAYADVVAIAIPFGAWPEFAKEVAPSLRNKIMFEATNPNVTRDGAVGEAALAKGSGQFIADLFPGVKIVRCASAVGAAMLSAEAGRPAPRLAIAVMYNDPAAKAVGIQLINDAGLDAFDAGPLTNAPKFAIGTPGAAARTLPDLKAFVAANP